MIFYIKLYNQPRFSAFASDIYCPKGITFFQLADTDNSTGREDVAARLDVDALTIGCAPARSVSSTRIPQAICAVFVLLVVELAAAIVFLERWDFRGGDRFTLWGNPINAVGRGLVSIHYAAHVPASSRGNRLPPWIQS